MKLTERIKKFLHDKLGWGYVCLGKCGGDNFQPTYKCRFCDKDLAQDSTGAWFHLSN